MNISPSENERHGLRYITPKENLNQGSFNHFLYDCIEHIAGAIESRYTDEYKVVYINSTIPQTLYKSMKTIKDSGKYSWLNNERMMRCFTYERISDINELDGLIEKIPDHNMIIIEDLQRILKNSVSNYNKNNYQLIRVVQFIKQTQSYIIDYSHHWFIDLLL